MEFDEEYKSWCENVVWRPREIYAPPTVAAMASYIREADHDERRVRAFGSKWSFSDVPLSHDYQISMANLSRILAMSEGSRRWGHGRQSAPDTEPMNSTPPDSLVLIAALDGLVIESGRRFAHVHAGVHVKELYSALDSPKWDTDQTGGYVEERGRWALPTMGGAAGQTIAGVISTSTHGADFGLEPIHAMVRAIDLIAPDGTRHWYERGGAARISNRPALEAALNTEGVPLTTHYDDDEFFSVLVSMGCMGVIHAFILELVPQFGLSQRSATTTWRTIRDSLKQDGQCFTLPPWVGLEIDPHPVLDGVTPTAHALEVFINPFRISDDYVGDPAPDRDCYVTSRAIRTDRIDPPAAGGGGKPCCVDLIHKITRFESGGPGTAKDVINETMTGLRTNTTNYPVGWSVTDLYTDPYPVLSLEIAIPTLGDRHLDLVDDMLDRVDKLILKQNGSKLAGALSVRFTLPSPTLLAIQNFPAALRETGTLVCHVEVICMKETGGLKEDERGLPYRNDAEGEGEAFLRGFEELAERYEAHLHWGHLSVTGRHAPQQYAQYGTWQAVRDGLTSGGAVRSFDNDFTVRYGISRGVPAWTAVSASLLPGSPTDAPRDARRARRYPPSVFRNREGCLELLVIGCDGHVCWNRQATANGTFLGWSFVQLPREGDDLGPSFGGRVAIGINRGNAHPEVFARRLGDGKICHAWRNVSDKKWGDWNILDGDHIFESSPDVLIAGDQNLLLVARRDDGMILCRSQKEELGVIGWHSWRVLRETPGGVTFAGDPCLGQNLDGRLEVFIRDTSGFVWRSQQAEAKGDSAWSSWGRVGTSATGSDAGVGRRDDGRLEVFAQSGASGLAHILQASPGAGYLGDWSLVGTFDFPLDPGGRPCVISSRHNLQVAVRTIDGRILHFDQNDDNWRFFDLSGPLVSDPAIGENDDQRLEAFAKFANDFVEHRWQSATFAW